MGSCLPEVTQPGGGGLSRGLSVGEVFTVGGQGDGTHTEV